MEKTKINQIKEFVGQSVEIEAWVHDVRDIGSLKFILIRDPTGILQVTVVKKESSEAILKAVEGVTNESVVVVKGKVQENSQVKVGIEIIPEEFEVLVACEAELPISVTEKGITTGQSKRLDWRCLDLRKLKHQSVFRIQSALIEGMREWLLNNDFVQAFTPCMMGVPSESGSEVFNVKYFDRTAFLRQDPQLHRQLMIASGFPKVFDLGPCWRAELSHTTHHLCEHRVCAAELGFIKDEKDTMRVEEQVIVSALKKVKEKCKSELEILGVDFEIPATPFPELKFPDIYEILKERGKEVAFGEDIDREAEKILYEYVKEKFGSEFYFINRFPSSVKPFYVMTLDEDPKWARSVDLCFRGLELSSGGQREHRYEKIMEAIKTKEMTAELVEWFTKFFKYGVPPHGGFAIGVERLTQSLLGIENIRDCTPFPRDPERVMP